MLNVIEMRFKVEKPQLLANEKKIIGILCNLEITILRRISILRKEITILRRIGILRNSPDSLNSP